VGGGGEAGEEREREAVVVGERRGFGVIKNLTCGSYGWVVGIGDLI